MQSDTTDRSDLYRLADDGCPNVPDRDTAVHDLSTPYFPDDLQLSVRHVRRNPGIPSVSDQSLPK